MRKHVWKPVVIGPGLRLYKVEVRFPNTPANNSESIVAAASPRAAARKIELLYAQSTWKEQPYFVGKALRVYQPDIELEW